MLQLAVPAPAQDDAAPPADTAANDKERGQRLEQMVAAAADYELWKGRDDEQPLVRVERPVLRWSNPFRAAGDGAVFIWADNDGQKRPAAAMCIYGNGPDGVDHEWQSLSTEVLRATYRGATVWCPQTAALEFHAVPSAEPAAATPARRLTQMHGLLRDFSATLGREPRQHELRLLTHPIYGYGDEQAVLVDGAIFAFAQATDPEILLLLEARRQNKAQPEDAPPASWWWAAARMSMVPLDVKYRGQLVWTIDWHRGSDDRHPRKVFHKTAEP